jgi:hypothetical protein
MISLRRTLLAAAIAALALSASSGAAAQASTTCSWAGTPAVPTGVMTINPGLTNLPAPRDVQFHAWGQLSGGPRCHGQVQFISVITAGSTCALAHFDGRVVGLPGVARFVGDGALDVPSRLFDRHGNVVGLENAEIATPTNLERSNDCQSPSGFRGGWPAMFSSTIELFG